MTWLLLVALTAFPITLRAQDIQEEQREGAASFAGGQMVRGTVSAATVDHLTVKTEAGVVYQVAVSANTRITKDRQPMKMADIKVGDGVGAMGILDAANKTIHAVFVGVLDAEQVRKAREGLGKIYILGKVTAVDMDALKLTVMRPDGVSQTIGVDEQTSFKRGGRGMANVVGSSSGNVSDAATSARDKNATSANGGESITFADVKIGDSVAARGALKNGVFVPSELGVMDAATMTQRNRRRNSENSNSGASATNPAGPVAVPQ
jgi:hypothetical protein